METLRSGLKKLLEVQTDEDGNNITVENLELHYKGQITPGESYEDMLSQLHRWVDRKFNDLFSAELGLMPERMAEGEHWKQQGLFDDEVEEVVGGVGAAVRDFIDASGRYDGDVEMTAGGRSVKIPKPKRAPVAQ